jgi:signal transduction histidine kinase
MAEIYLLMILVSDWKIFTAMTSLGTLSACLAVFVIDGYLSVEEFRVEYVPIIGFVFASGLVCIHKKNLDSERKIKIISSKAGSIAHEIRNPLNAINLIWFANK